MFFKLHFHWLSSYKIIILPFNFHFRNSGWAHCWEPSQSQRNSPQWPSGTWTAQELLTKSSWCCSWTRPLPGHNGSFQEVQIVLCNLVLFSVMRWICFFLWWDEYLVRFSVQNMPETWGTAAGSGMRLKCTQTCSRVCMNGCVWAHTLQERRWEQKALSVKFWRYSPKWLLTVAVSELEHFLGNTNLHTVLAGRLEEWAPGSCWDKLGVKKTCTSGSTL